MKIILSLNDSNKVYDYLSMGIDTFILGGKYSFYCPYCFSLDEMKSLLIKHKANYYVNMNAIYDQHLMEDIEDYLKQLSEMNIQGILFQDFGIMQIVKERGYHFDMIYSPETLNTNAETLNALEKQGINGAFVSKVIPLEEQLIILNNTKMPLMIHGHGVEYIAASKRKLLSNYQEASLKEFDKSQKSHLRLQARNSDYSFQIYENDFGTRIFSKTRLFTLDLLNQIHEFDYLYIETLMMKEEEAIEVTSLYSDALKAFQENNYDRNIKEYMTLLYQLNSPLDRGFLFDQTVYKLEDVRKMDNAKRESNH